MFPNTIHPYSKIQAILPSAHLKTEGPFLALKDNLPVPASLRKAREHLTYV